MPQMLIRVGEEMNGDLMDLKEILDKEEFTPETYEQFYVLCNKITKQVYAQWLPSEESLKKGEE